MEQLVWHNPLKNKTHNGKEPTHFRTPSFLKALNTIGYFVLQCLTVAIIGILSFPLFARSINTTYLEAPYREPAQFDEDIYMSTLEYSERVHPYVHHRAEQIRKIAKSTHTLQKYVEDTQSSLSQLSRIVKSTPTYSLSEQDILESRVDQCRTNKVLLLIHHELQQWGLGRTTPSLRRPPCTTTQKIQEELTHFKKQLAAAKQAIRILETSKQLYREALIRTIVTKHLCSSVSLRQLT